MNETSRRYWWYLFIPIVVAIAASVILKVPAALKCDPDPELECSELNAEQTKRFNLATDNWRSGHSYEALRILNELISECPGDPELYKTKGRIYLDSLKNYDLAIEQFKICLEKAPNQKAAKFNLALSYFRIGDTPEAVRLNAEVLDIDRDDPSVRYNHGVYLMKRNSESGEERFCREAVPHFRFVVNKGGDWSAQAMYNLAAALCCIAAGEPDEKTRRKHLTEALEHLDRFIEIKKADGLDDVTGNGTRHVNYSEYLDILRQDPAYLNMIEKWKGTFKLSSGVSH